MTLDAMKLTRDGHLYYGLPNARRIKAARCVENGHDDEWIEYGGGVMRCLGCLAVWLGWLTAPLPQSVVDGSGSHEAGAP
jgi:hypothetical protein